LATFLMLLLLILTFCAFLYCSRRITTGMLLLALGCYFAIGDGWVPNVLIKPLESPYYTLLGPEWGTRNAIVLLGAGTTELPWRNKKIVYPTLISYSRIQEAARLYFSCKETGNGCTVLISGGDATRTGLSEAALYRTQLQGLGVNPSHIQLESHSLNTFQNAQLSQPLLQHFDRIFMVTSALHMQRALLYFSHFGIHATPSPSDFVIPIRTWAPLGYNFALTDQALHEYAGLLRYYMYNVLHWNPPAKAA